MCHRLRLVRRLALVQARQRRLAVRVLERFEHERRDGRDQVRPQLRRQRGQVVGRAELSRPGRLDDVSLARIERQRDDRVLFLLLDRCAFEGLGLPRIERNAVRARLRADADGVVLLALDPIFEQLAEIHHRAALEECLLDVHRRIGVPQEHRQERLVPDLVDLIVGNRRRRSGYRRDLEILDHQPCTGLRADLADGLLVPVATIRF